MRQSRMHPGWACFFAAFGSGVFTAIAMLAAVRWLQGWDRAGMTAIAAAIAIGLYTIGARKAETLDDSRNQDRSSSVL